MGNRGNFVFLQIIYIGMKRALFFIVLICGVALCGCNNSKTSQKGVIMSRSFLDCLWERFDFVTADIEIDKETTFNLSMDISFTEVYRYQDFTMVFTVFDANDNPYRSKEYKFKLKDKDGNWNIEKKDDAYTFNFPINSELLLSDAGMYKFQIEYRMPITPLEGVKEVKIKNQ